MLTSPNIIRKQRTFSSYVKIHFDYVPPRADSDFQTAALILAFKPTRKAFSHSLFSIARCSYFKETKAILTAISTMTRFPFPFPLLFWIATLDPYRQLYTVIKSITQLHLYPFICIPIHTFLTEQMIN